MALTGFWAKIDSQLEELASAKSADDVLAICPPIEGMSYGHGFFEGGGGDYTPRDPLLQTGWTIIWSEASYHYALRSPDGSSSITYVEGDLYRGDTRESAVVES